RVRLLTGGSRTAPLRHQTLRAALDWSYNLLADAARMLLRRLSVFAGGWTLAAAEAVCAGDGCEPSTVFDILIRLVDRSLVIVENLDGRDTWYRLIETVRLYARAKLVAAGEEEVVRRPHRAWYLQFAEHAEPELQVMALESWLARLDAELDSIRAVQVLCKTSGPAHVSGLC